MVTNLKVLLVFLILSWCLAQPPQLVQTQFEIMLRAVKDDVYASFVSAGTDEFKTKYIKESFDLLRNLTATRLSTGYEVNYLGTLNLRGYAVFLWKLSYTDGGDDSLVSLSVDNGFVAGFLIQ